MEGMQAMKDLLEAFGASIGVGSLMPDESGYACLSVDDALVIHLVYDEESEALRMFSELGEVPLSHEKAVMRALLDANVLWRGSQGATLGLDSAKRVVTLTRQVPVSLLSPERFGHLLEAFIATSENWIKNVADIVRECVGDQAVDGVARAPVDDSLAPSVLWDSRA